MPKNILLEATLKKGVNKRFRIQTKIIHLIHRNNEVKQFPIIINNFNRLHWLEQQVEWLLKVGQKNIHIIDNTSTYQPLLAYYKKVPATVYMLDRNVGHEAFWRTHLHQRLGKYYHVYTDPDVLPDENTPEDFMYYFKEKLDKYPLIKKVGFGLRIDNLPDFYPAKSKVIKWEEQLNNQEVEAGLYRSKIDTTFALYRPGAAFQCWDETLRTGAPYLLRHEPWYEDPANMSLESNFYLQNANSASSWYDTLKGKTNTYDD